MEIKQKLYETKTEDLDQKGRVRIAVNAFGNTDSDGDISLPGSFKKTLKEHFARVRWFLNHDMRILLGVPVKGTETEEYLIMEAQFNMEKQISRDTYEDYKLYLEFGKSLEHSVGLEAIKYTIDRTDPDKWIRRISEWKLWEFSTLTFWGANENTPLLGIKSLLTAFSEPERVKEILSRMNTGNYSDTRRQLAEQSYISLFEEPSRDTLNQKADISVLFSTINRLKF